MRVVRAWVAVVVCVVLVGGTWAASPPSASAFTAATSMPPFGVDFLGEGNTHTPGIVTGTPPDTTGAVGPSDYVQLVNSGYEVFSKTGTVIQAAQSTNNLWAGYTGTNAGNGCSTQNDGDGEVRYDQLADRWIITQFSLPNVAGPSFQCVAVSKTGDPTGGWNRYDFQYNEAINDYPKIAVWPNAYYVTYNLFGATGGYDGTEVCAWDRAKMLADLAATQKCVTLSTAYFSLLAANLDGTVLPPAGSPEYIVAEKYDSVTNLGTDLNVWKMSVDFSTSAPATLSGPTVVPSSYTDGCSTSANGNCVPQPGSTVTLDGLGDRVMDRLAYRNFGTHESLVLSKTASAGAGTGIKWWEIRVPGGTPTLYQEGTYAPSDANWRWMPSLAMDQAGNIALGFSISSNGSGTGAVAHPGMGWVGRLASDPLGQMPLTETKLDIGTANESDAYPGPPDQHRGRWGDYSNMAVDPSDDCTFWYTNELYNTAGVGTWDTRIASVKLPGCGANDFSIDRTSASVSATQGSGTTNAITTALTKGTAESVTLSASGLPTGATAMFNPPTVTAGNGSTLTLSTGPTTPLGTYPITVVGTAASAYHAAPQAFDLVVTADTAPSCTSQSGLLTTKGNGLPVTLACNDPDVGDSVKYAIVGSPAHGLVSAPDASGHVTYTPAAGYAGPDSFTFKATDNDGVDSTTASVALLVDTPPACADQSGLTTGHDTALPITLSCTDADSGDTVAYAIVSQPAHGVASAPDAAGHTTYAPTSGYAGPDSFTFRATDDHGVSSTTATVSLTVAPAGSPTPSTAPSGSPSPSPSPPSTFARTGVGLALTLSGAAHYKLSRAVPSAPLRVTRDRAHHIVKITARWSVPGLKGGTATITFSLTKTKRGWIGTITVGDRRVHVVVTLKPTGAVSARGSTLRGTGTGAVKVHGVAKTVTLHWSITTGVALPHVRFE